MCDTEELNVNLVIGNADDVSTPNNNSTAEKENNDTNHASSSCELIERKEKDDDPMSKNGEEICVSLIFGKDKHSIKVFLDEDVSDFKQKVEELTGVPPSMQKLMCKGMLQDGQTLRNCKLLNGCKIMLVGSKPNDIFAVNVQPKPQDLKQEETQATKKEPLCTQKQHLKILEKGIPDDAIPGIKNAKDALPDFPISGMLNKLGGKVRLTFKLEVDQVWIGTKERTEKVPMSQIKSVINEPIEGHEEYHILALQLGPTEQSRYYFYWVPAQYVDAIKEAIMGS